MATLFVRRLAATSVATLLLRLRTAI